MMSALTAREVIGLLDLKPHPEGGHYRETFRDPLRTSGPDRSERSVSTAIYFLLGEGERSHWHRLDAAELWHHYAGAPLMLWLAADGGVNGVRLGRDLLAGERPQAVVHAGVWQSAEALGAWSLVGCTVAPGFEFAGFEIAPSDFAPPRSPA
jgi:uncharacterized protein